MLLLSALLLASAGCKRSGGDPVDVIPSDAFLPTSVPTDAPTPEPAYTSGNDVFDMLTKFFREYTPAASGIIEAVYASGDRAIISECFMLLRDETYVARLYASVGMLAYNEESFRCSGSVSGAYGGSGSVLPDGEFEYEFESGGSVSGSITDKSRIEAVFSIGGGSVTVTVNMLDEGFVFFVRSGSFTGICEVRDGYIRYGRFPSAQVFDLGDGGFPDIADAEIFIYSDGSVSFSE